MNYKNSCELGNLILNLELNSSLKLIPLTQSVPLVLWAQRCEFSLNVNICKVVPSPVAKQLSLYHFTHGCVQRHSLTLSSTFYYQGPVDLNNIHLGRNQWATYPQGAFYSTLITRTVLYVWSQPMSVRIM